MNENYIVINGKRAELTEEQMKALGIETKKKRKNPFERVGSDDKYYFAIVGGDVLRRVDINDRTDRMSYNAINYFNDKKFANQVALHQLLYRKLLKYAYENECEDVEWNAEHTHWYIYYNIDSDKFDIGKNTICKQQGVYFSTSRGAERAIEEVIKPFMKEHPEFVW